MRVSSSRLRPEFRCLRNGQEERLRKQKLGRNLQFFLHFALDRCTRMFIWLDVTTTWQPQAGLAVVNQQQVPASSIKQDKVRNQMLGRSGGFVNATEWCA